MVNKELKQRVEKLEKETKEILERKIFKEEEKDLVSIQNLSVEGRNSNRNSSQQSNMQLDVVENKVKYEPVMAKNPRMIVDIKNHNQADSRSGEDVVSFEMRSVISNRNKNEVDRLMGNDNIRDKEIYGEGDVSSKNIIQNYGQLIFLDDDIECDREEIDKDPVVFDLNDFVQKKGKVVPNIQENKRRIDYLKDVSYQMAKELQPQTIELTDYEKDQEEHAVISYQELLALKDEIKIQNDDEDAIRFIDDLKKFKNHLS